MMDTLTAVFGELSMNELMLVGVFFMCVAMFSWAPRIGEAIGGLFGKSDDL